MKITQVTSAVGSTAAALTLGLTTHAVAWGIPPSTARAGHCYQQAPGEILTGLEVAKRCRAAYAALQTYQVTSAVTVRTVESPSGKAEDEHASAVIQFARPGKIHVEGLDTQAKPFAFISDGSATVQTDSPKQGPWKKVPGYQNPNGIEMAIAGVTGSAMNAATTVPALLLDTDPGSTYGGWGVPPALGKGFVASGGNPSNPFTKMLQLEVKEDTFQSHPCYVLTPHSSALAGLATLWIDKKTFLLRRTVTDYDTAAQIVPVGGAGNQAIPAMKMHQEETYTNEQVNEAIASSTFTLPAAR